MLKKHLTLNILVFQIDYLQKLKKIKNLNLNPTLK